MITTYYTDFATLKLKCDYAYVHAILNYYDHTLTIYENFEPREKIFEISSQSDAIKRFSDYIKNNHISSGEMAN